MTGGELRALREGAGLTQAEAASVLDVPASTYAKRERGESEIPDEMAGRAARVLGGLRGAVLPDEAATERELRLALGEAAMLLGPEQRAELTRVVGNALVDDAVARAVTARVGRTLADEVARQEARIRELTEARDRVRDAVGGAR